MAFMLFLLFIAVLVSISIAQGSRKRLGDMLNVLLRFSDELSALRKQVAELKEEIDRKGNILGVTPAEPLSENSAREEERQQNNIIDESPASAPDEVEQAEISSEHYDAPAQETTPPPIKPLPTDAAITETTEEQPELHGAAQHHYAKARKSTDLERFIGENLINKVGIAVLLLGISFFVKYAIDKDWINEAGRVSIGMLCGAVLIAVAHYLRKEYRSFSSVLAGGGIAVFYFTTAFAYHRYHLMPQQLTFLVMVVVTAFAVLLSVLYDRLELAVIAAIGGFITPFLVSNGEGNYIALFTYLLVLDTGLLTLAWYRRWPTLNIIALLFTQLIYAGWLGSTFFQHTAYSTPVAILFAALFYSIFLAMNMIYQLRNGQFFRSLDLYLLLLTSASFYACGMVLLKDWHGGDFRGVFTLVVGGLNLFLAWFVHKRTLKDRNLFYLLTGLTLTFITLAIPVQLHGRAITLFWFAEVVLLYWLFLRSDIAMFKYSSLIVCALATMSLLMDWNVTYASTHDQGLLLFTDLQGMVNSVFAAAAFFTWYLLLRKRVDVDFVQGVPGNIIATQALWAATGILYLTAISGLNLALPPSHGPGLAANFHLVTTGVFALIVLHFFPRARANEVVNQVYSIGPAVAMVVHYLIATAATGDLLSAVLHGRTSMGYFAAHWLAVALLIAVITSVVSHARKTGMLQQRQGNTILVVTVLVAVTTLSIELQQLYLLIGYNGHNMHSLRHGYSKVGLSATWGVCSFITMWIGMKGNRKTLRILSLALFSVVLFKLFVFDLSGISEGGKIFAFILLGVILLVVSFMYQRLKKIIFDDRTEDQ